MRFPRGRPAWTASTIGLFALAVAPALAPIGARRAAASGLEMLVMPGDVIRGHAEVEADCRRCHRPFQVGSQATLCLECHEEIREDRRSETGFHGRAAGAREATCRSCHPEHRGRDADATGLDPETFDHELTDHPLLGAHARARCDQCHRPAEKYRKAASDCITCHRDDDRHQGRLGTQCGECHLERLWGEARFDHGKTSFRLDGRHREVECSLCHPGEHYRNTATDCRSCHRLNDAHLGRFGSECAPCHTPRDWSTILFDHDHATKFALEGRHRDLDCDACHTQPLHQPELPTDCHSCHRSDDDHLGQNGTRCQKCHDASSWRISTFDHDSMTKFPLRGAHRPLKCRECHPGTLYRKELDTSCHGCHQPDDVHRGQQGRDCQVCHDQTSWRSELFFDHDLTSFPLLGLHAAAACDQCHPTPRFRDPDTRCASCHAEEDVHLDRLGPSCESCHNPNGWKIWRFEHDSQTRFPLRESHQDLDCHACHRAPIEERIEIHRGCQLCHGEDDPHRGAYGRDCARCHRETRWNDVTQIR